MPTPADRMLRDFKGNLKAPLPLHPLEKALLAVVALNVCSLPWMLGGMRPWAQFISLALSLVAVILSLIPRNYEGNLVHEQDYRLYPHRKLIRWPIFWIGLVFFGYVLIQALNPAWEFVQLENAWGMRKIEHIAWLPSGMRTPFEMMNSWRQMLIWGGPFLLACALWVGVTRKKPVIIILTTLVTNATILAVVGVVARYTAPDKVLWLIPGKPDYCFSSFIYKNHAGSFFALFVGLCTALAVWNHVHVRRHLRRSGPTGLFVIMAIFLMVAVLLTYSRAAILITGSFLVVATFIGIWRLIRNSSGREAPFAIAAFGIGLVTFAIIGAQLVDSQKTLDRISSLTDETYPDRSVVLRQVAWQAGLEMASERPNLGWGAGGFRFLFPRYQTKYPEITRAPWGKQRFTFWEHAHNDYLQTYIEMGRIGGALVALGALTLGVGFIRRRGLRNITACCLAGTVAITLFHAFTDFPFQNPAILVSWTCASILTLLLAQFEHHANRTG